MYPIDDRQLLIETIRAVIATHGALSVDDLERVVNGAVRAVIDADRAYRIYIKELSDKSRLGL